MCRLNTVQLFTKANPSGKKGMAGLYGMMAHVPKTVVDEFILEFFSQVYKD